MNFNLTIVQIQNLIQSSPVSEISEEIQVLTAIKQKNVFNLLKTQIDNGNLSSFLTSYNKFKLENKNSIIQFLSGSILDKKISDVIIALYFLDSMKTGRTLNFSVYETEKNRQLFTPEEIDEQHEYLRTMIRRMAFKLPTLTIPEYAERYIDVIVGPKPGRFSLKSFPPIEKPLLDMSPQSKIQNVFIMGSIQTWKTMLLDLVALYWVDHCPQDSLYISSTERQGIKWRTRRFEPMLNAAGVRDRHIVGAFNERKGSRRTGETVHSIEIDGKVLDIGTANSASSMSSDTKRILMLDEVARFPDDVGGEGSPYQVAAGRVSAWGLLGKIMAVSSPLIEGSCQMEALYKTGNQQIYFATCPFCGKSQPLFRGAIEGRSGLKWETKAGKIDYTTLGYVCDFCGEKIYEHQKSQMLQKEQPRPIAHPERQPEIPDWHEQRPADDPWITSYQMNAIYSPFFSWRKYASEYNKAVKNPDLMQVFVNQRDGLPFKIVGMKPDIENVVILRGSYQSREIPHEVLFLTAAVDVQHGQEGWESDDSKEPPRLELEIKGHGEGYRLFGIEYKTFSGYLDDIYSGAWQKFREYIDGGGFVFKQRGETYDVKLCLIDARSAKYTDQIYNFCREMGITKFSPSLGFNVLPNRKKGYDGIDSEDESGRHDYDRYRRKQKNDIIIYEISTYIYKMALYTRINTSVNFTKERPGENTPSGYIGFPEDYTDHYLDMLLSEELIPGSPGNEPKFRQIKKRNEALDITVYNMAAGEIWLYQQVVFFRSMFSVMKAPAAFIQGITASFVIKILKKAKEKGRNLSPAEIRQQLETGK